MTDHPKDSSSGTLADGDSYKGWLAALKLLRAKQPEGARPEELPDDMDNTVERRSPLPQSAFLSLERTASDYLVLPNHLAFARTGSDAPLWGWRVELHGLPQATEPLGLDILGSIVLGRNTSDESPADLDLTPYGGGELGVSRRHALIQMTRNNLHLIDLGSTNGTRFNGAFVVVGGAVSLAYGDKVSIGDLSFAIKIISRPGVGSSIAGATRPSLGQK